MDDLITTISNLKNQYVDGNGSGKKYRPLGVE